MSGQSRIAPLTQIPNSRDERINLFALLAGVVKSQHGAERALQSKAVPDGLRAMMAAADSNPSAIEIVADLFGAETSITKNRMPAFSFAAPMMVRPGIFWSAVVA
jgi:hypothetical protein